MKSYKNLDVSPKHSSFKDLSSQELLALSGENENTKKNVMQYIYDMLEPYSKIHHYAKKTIAQGQEHAKRALALAATFNPSNIEMILKLYPEILSSVIETSTVTITDPITKQPFTAVWHFKLSHLLAAMGNTWGLNCLSRIYSEKYEDNYRNQLSQFFSEPICWESGIKTGNKGPTATFIAILFNNNKFFHDISTHGEPTLKDGYDEPYSQFNPYHIALQQRLTSQKNHCFSTLINSYSPRIPISMIEDFISHITKQALQGNHTPLIILLDLSSDFVRPHLASGLFMALEKNNMDVVKLIGTQITSFHHIQDENDKSILSIATQKAIENLEYLPMVKHFLCYGCQPKIEKNLLNGNQSDSNKKQIQHYFEVAEYFDDFIQLCTENKYSFRFLSFSNNKENNPENLLFKIANLDKEFFNELVISFLENENKPILDKQLNRFDTKRFYTYLLNFENEHHHAFHLTADTLEKMADSLINGSDIDARTMAAQFYKLVIVKTNNAERLEQKLQTIGTHKEPTRNVFARNK